MSDFGLDVTRGADDLLFLCLNRPSTKPKALSELQALVDKARLELARRPLFVFQGDDGINPRSTARRNIARKDRYLHHSSDTARHSHKINGPLVRTVWSISEKLRKQSGKQACARRANANEAARNGQPQPSGCNGTPKAEFSSSSERNPTSGDIS